MVEVAPKYEVSNLGHLRNRRTGRVLRPYYANGKYARVSLATLMDGERPVDIARQVLISFTPYVLRQHEIVGYKDGNPRNVNIENLYWTTYEAMRQRQWDTGAYKKRRTYHFNKEDLAKAVKLSRKARGLPVAALAALLFCLNGCVSLSYYQRMVREARESPIIMEVALPGTYLCHCGQRHRLPRVKDSRGG